MKDGKYTLMKLETIMEMWDKDSKIDWTQPGKAAIGIPAVHNKYLKEYTNARMRLKVINGLLSEMVSIKFQYYSGYMDKDMLKSHGWQQFTIKLKTKSGIEKMIEGDEDILKLQSRIANVEEKMLYLETVMKMLSNSNFMITNYISWEKFQAGSY